MSGRGDARIVPVAAPRPAIVGGPGTAHGIPSWQGGGGSILVHPDSTQVLPRQSARTYTMPGLDSCVAAAYGQVPIGGNIVFWKKSGGRTYVGFGLVNHEISSLSASGILFGTTTMAQLGLSVSGTDYKIYLGTDTQALDSTLHALDADWKFKYDGTEVDDDGNPVPKLAWFWCAFKNPTDSIPAPDIEGMTATGHWRLCRDPVLDPSLAARYWTRNPALIHADLKTSPFAQALPDWMLNWDDVAAAAADCDYDIGGGTKRYVMDLSLRSPQPWPDLEEAVRQHYMGQLAWNSGKFRFWVDKPSTWGGLIFSDGTDGNPANITLDSQLGISMKPSDEVWTVVEVTYSDSADGYKEKTITVRNPDTLTGALAERKGSFRLVGTPTGEQAKRIAIQIYNRAFILDRYVAIRTNEEGTRVLPGNIIKVHTQLLGTVLLLVTDVESPRGLSLGWKITGEIYDDAAYMDTVQTVASNSGFIPAGPDEEPPRPTAFSVAEIEKLGTDGVLRGWLKVTWVDAVSDYNVATRIRIDDGFGNDEQHDVPKGTQFYLFPDPVLGRAYIVTAQTVNTKGLVSTVDGSTSDMITPTFDQGTAIPDVTGLVEVSPYTGQVVFTPPAGAGKDLVAGFEALNILADPVNPPRMTTLDILSAPSASHPWDLSPWITSTPSSGRDFGVRVRSFSRKLPTSGAVATSPGVDLSWHAPPVLTVFHKHVLARGYGIIRSTGSTWAIARAGTGTFLAQSGIGIWASSNQLWRGWMIAALGLPSDATILGARIFFVYNTGNGHDTTPGASTLIEANQGTQTHDMPTSADWAAFTGSPIGAVSADTPVGGGIIIPLTSFGAIVAGAGDTKICLRSSFDVTNTPPASGEIECESDETVASAFKPAIGVDYTSASEGAALGGGGANISPFSMAYTPGTNTYAVTSGSYAQVKIGNLPLIPGVDFSFAVGVITLRTVGGQTPAARFPNSDTIWGEVIS